LAQGASAAQGSQRPRLEHQAPRDPRRQEVAPPFPILAVLGYLLQVGLLW
jgi:hypothetical protein